MFYHFLQIFLSPIVRFLWIKKVQGLWHIPSHGGAVLVANHSSFLDPVVVSSVVSRRIYYMAGEWVFKKPVFGLIARVMASIRVERSSCANNEAAIDTCVNLVKRGDLVMVFPEGSLAKAWILRKPFTGAARIAGAAHAPIIPLGICGTYEIQPYNRAFPKIAKKVVLTVGKPLSIENRSKNPDDRQYFVECMDSVMEKIGELCGLKYDKAEWSDDAPSKLRKNIIGGKLAVTLFLA